MENILKAIRQDCRLAMNGVVSTSMREYGLDYKLNFGLVAQQIKALADKYGPSASLAERLWDETTRELRILATLVYPVDEFTPETANKWITGITNQEIREQVCMNLFQALPFASQLAIEWSQKEDKQIRTTGYWLMARLLLTKKFQEKLNTTYFDKYIWEDIFSEDIFIRNASTLVLKHIARQSKAQADIILGKLRPYKEDENLLKQEAYRGIAFEAEFAHS